MYGDLSSPRRSNLADTYIAHTFIYIYTLYIALGTKSPPPPQLTTRTGGASND